MIDYRTLWKRIDTPLNHSFSVIGATDSEAALPYLAPGAVMFDLAMSASATRRRFWMRWNKTETHFHEYTKFIISCNYTFDIFVRDSFLLLDFVSKIGTSIPYIDIQSMLFGNK